MLLQISVENFKSIKNRINFSMLATKDDLHEDYKRVLNGYEVLPTSMIMGTNGAGKSNLFLAINYLQLLLKDEEIEFSPHLLSDENTPTQIDIQFIVNEIRFAYGIDILNDEVIGEYLYRYKNNKEAIIFEREYDEINIHSSYEGELTKFKENDRTKLLLTALYYHSTITTIKEVYQFLTEKMFIITPDNINEQELFKQSIALFKASDMKLIDDLLNQIDNGIIRFETVNNHIKVKYDNMEINLLEESTGTKKLFTLLVLLSNAINENNVILFDELEKNLHPVIVLYFINVFNNCINKQAQLIFTAHETSLLNLSYFRRDQIWFMEKDLNTMSTDCYSLYNIKDVKQHENIEKGYILGKYGATYQIKNGGVVRNEK